MLILFLILSASTLSNGGVDGRLPGAESFATASNRIVFPAATRLNERFSTLVGLAQAGREPLRILHIGDSHIQADLFTGETRRLLSWWLSDSLTSRGFTFPYRVAGTNNPTDFRATARGEWSVQRTKPNGISDHFGIAGVVLTSTAGSSIDFKLNVLNGYSQRIDIVKIYTDELTIPPAISVPSAVLYHQSNGLAHFIFNEPTDSFSIVVRDASPPACFRFYGAELVHSRSKVLYHAAGLNGTTVGTYLQSQNMGEQLRALQPHLVIISLGTNDAFFDNYQLDVFTQNLRELVGKISSSMPSAMIILTTPGDHYIKRLYANQRLKLVRSSILHVAEEMGCGTWDFYSLMGGAGGMKQWLLRGLSAPDMVHLSEKGYKLQGEMLFKALAELTLFSADRPLNYQ